MGVSITRNRTFSNCWRPSGAAWTVEGRLVFAVDGARIACPMTAANEQAFGCGGKKKTAPQQYIVTLFPVGTGLPWG